MFPVLIRLQILWWMLALFLRLALQNIPKITSCVICCINHVSSFFFFSSHDDDDDDSDNEQLINTL